MGYLLKGYVFYETGSCHNDHQIDINEEIKEDNLEHAIQKAKEIVEAYHKRYQYKSEYRISVVLGKSSFVPYWSMDYIPPQEAEPAVSEKVIPAKTAVPASPGRFEETKY